MIRKGNVRRHADDCRLKLAQSPSSGAHAGIPQRLRPSVRTWCIRRGCEVEPTVVTAAGNGVTSSRSADRPSAHYRRWRTQNSVAHGVAPCWCTRSCNRLYCRMRNERGHDIRSFSKRHPSHARQQIRSRNSHCYKFTQGPAVRSCSVKSPSPGECGKRAGSTR